MKGTSPLLTSPRVCLASLLLCGPVGMPDALALGVSPWSSCLPLTEPSSSTWGCPPPSIPPHDSHGLDDAAGTAETPGSEHPPLAPPARGALLDPRGSFPEQHLDQH